MKIFNRKFISAALALTIAASGVVASSAMEGRFGDINNDGSINSTDALMILKHATETELLKGDAVLRSDVNADKKVNSLDALDVLKYSVGLIYEFEADKVKPDVPEVPADKNEILALYSEAVTKAHSIKPSFRIDALQEGRDADVKLSGLAAALMKPEEKKKVEEEAEAELNTLQPYRTIVKKGSDNSNQLIPPVFTLKDASGLKSITCVLNKAGNYEIEILFRNEVNPDKASPLVQILGAADYQSTLDALKEGSSVEGVTANIDSLKLDYRDSFIKCEINPANNEFVSINTKITLLNENQVSVAGLATVNTKFTMINTAELFDFGY